MAEHGVARCLLASLKTRTRTSASTSPSGAVWRKGLGHFGVSQFSRAQPGLLKERLNSQPMAKYLKFNNRTILVRERNLEVEYWSLKIFTVVVETLSNSGIDFFPSSYDYHNQSLGFSHRGTREHPEYRNCLVLRYSWFQSPVPHGPLSTDW